MPDLTMEEHPGKDNQSKQSASAHHEDELEFVLQALYDVDFANSPDFLEWLAKSDQNKALYEECSLYREVGLRQETPLVADVEQEWSKFSRSMEEVASSSKQLNLRVWPGA